MKQLRPTLRSQSGISVLEIVISVLIVLALAALTLPVTKGFKDRAEKAKCLSHMRSIHTGLMSYIQDHGHWPQMEEGEYEYTEDEFFNFWVEATEDQGLNPEVWICPSDRPEERKIDPQKEFYGSYIPVRFDEKPATPFRWNQPWIIERGNFHGKGAHMLMPDGSIQESMNPFSGR